MFWIESFDGSGHEEVLEQANYWLERHPNCKPVTINYSEAVNRAVLVIAIEGPAADNPAYDDHH